MTNTQHFTGKVAKIYARTGSGRGGKPWTSYSFKMQDQDGTWLNPFFRLKDAPKFAEGDYIQFDAEKIDDNAMQVVQGSGGKWQPAAPAAEDRGSIPAGPASTSAPAKSPGKSYAGGGAKDSYWEGKEKRDIEYTQPRISYQAARNAAIAVVEVLSANKALPISEAAAKAGVAKRYEQIIDIVNKLTVQFHNDTDTLRLLSSVADAGVVSVPNPGSLPEDSQADDADDSEGGVVDAGGSW